MAKYSAENERLKREYLVYLRTAKGLSDASLDAVAKAILRFEESTKFRDFKKFHIEQAIAFHTHLQEATNRAGKPLSAGTMLQTLNALRAFFLWLAGKPGYRSRIAYADAEYFRLSEKDTRVAKAPQGRPIPTAEQIRRAIDAMPATTEIEKRDRAVVALTFLTIVRDGALVSLKLKHVDLVGGKLIQDPREVRTKFSKRITTWFFPVGDDIRSIIADWVAFLRQVKFFGDDDPLFPATKVINGEDLTFKADGLTRSHWVNAAPVRKIFREAFVRVGLPYFHPHSFRHALGRIGQTRCRTPEELKAWSQNMGHSDVMTTLMNYGDVPLIRQGEIMKTLSGGTDTEVDAKEAFRQIAALASRAGG
jgi:integrase